MHPLVQEIARTPSADDPHRSAKAITRARENATDLLLVAGAGPFAQRPELWSIQRRWFPHIEALAASTRPEHDSEKSAVLFGWLGTSKQAQGDHRGAITFLARAADDFEHLHAPGHPQTVQSRLLLALAHRDAGDAALSLEMQEAIVPVAVESFGATHEITLAGRASLGTAYAVAGDYARATRELNALTELCVAEYGEQDPNTLLARRNLAGVLANSGRADEALEIYEAVYALTLAEHGQDAPATLLDAQNLAFGLRKAGRLDLAIELFEFVANRRKEVLGEEHPHTLSSLASLAVVVGEAGDYVRDQELTEQVLAIRERVLGPDHPKTQDTRDGLRSLITRNKYAKRPPTPD